MLNFYPTIDPKTKIWKKWKKHLKILSFYTCVPWMKIIWCMVSEIWSVTGTIFSFWTIFCPLTLLTTQKMKILKKWEQHPEILPLYTCVPHMMIMWCTVPEISSVTYIFFSLLTLLPLCNPENQNFEKNEK